MIHSDAVDTQQVDVGGFLIAAQAIHRAIAHRLTLILIHPIIYLMAIVDGCMQLECTSRACLQPLALHDPYLLICERVWIDWQGGGAVT
jgi:hypothetical protein